MSLLSYKCFNSYYYFLLYWIIDLISSLMDYFLENHVYEEKEWKEIDYIDLIFMNISDLSAGILVLITNCRMKSEKEDEKKVEKLKTSNNNYQLIYTDLSIKRYKFRLTFLMSLIELTGRSSNFIYHLIFPNSEILNHKIIWLISVDILSRIFFMNKILKTKLEKHHIVSVFLLLIGFLPMTIDGIIDVPHSNCAMYLFFIIPRNILFPLGDTISKILLTDKFMLPQNLMFYKGLLNLFMHLIVLLILLHTKSLNFDGNFFSNISILTVLLFILNLIFKFSKFFCIMKILYIFSVQHVCFVNAVSWLIILIQYFILKKIHSLSIYIYIISFLIVIFGTLLFNEIIIINVCDLNKNTKAKILEREKEEINQLNMFSNGNNILINEDESIISNING